MYLVETELWGALEPTREELEDASVVLPGLRTAEGDLRFVMVADIRGGVDRGNFLAWFQGGRAFVRLDEHRDHYATDSSIRNLPDEAIRFEGDGDSFEVPFAQSVSRAQALDALEIWLTTGQMSPSLEWS